MPMHFFLPSPLLYSKTGVYRGINNFSYFCSKTLWILVRTVRTIYVQNYEKYQKVLSDSFFFFFFFFFLHFLVVKFLVYYNRYVFVMSTTSFSCIAFTQKK